RLKWMATRSPSFQVREGKIAHPSEMEDVSSPTDSLNGPAHSGIRTRRPKVADPEMRKVKVEVPWRGKSLFCCTVTLAPLSGTVALELSRVFTIKASFPSAFRTR